MEQNQQLSFADAEYANKGKVTRREKFLAQLEVIRIKQRIKYWT